MATETLYKSRTTPNLELMVQMLTEALARNRRHELRVIKTVTKLAKTRTLRKIAERYEHINHGDVCRIVKKGRLPKSADKRLALGLPPIVEIPTRLGEAARCDACGKLHAGDCKGNILTRYRKVQLADDTPCTSWDGKRMTLGQLREHIKQNLPPAMNLYPVGNRGFEGMTA